MGRSYSNSGPRKNKGVDLIKVEQRDLEKSQEYEHHFKDLYCLRESCFAKNSIEFYNIQYVGNTIDDELVKLSFSFKNNSFQIGINFGIGDCEINRDLNFKTGKSYVFELDKGTSVSMRNIIYLISNVFKWKIDNVIYFDDL